MSVPHAESPAAQLVQHSIHRVLVSQSSLHSAQDILERTRRAVEASVSRLRQSQSLASAPFHRSWNRLPPGD